MIKSTLFLLLFFHTFARAANNFDDDLAFQPDSQYKLNVGSAVPASHSRRYLIYDVNPGEGFNLRRDVYLRVANLLKILREKQDWVLVLPPWRRLYHWRSSVEQNAVPWRVFFDIKSISLYVPAIEFEEFVQETGAPEIEEIIYLQKYKEGWTSGTWEEKLDDRECIDRPAYRKDGSGLYRGYFWGMSEVYGLNFRCLSVQGRANVLAPLLEKMQAKSVMIDRFEEVLHIDYGRSEYWKARRSLVFAKHLRDEADTFRKDVLQSNDKDDETFLEDDWTMNKRPEGSAKGGPYLAVHFRRMDFLYAHPKKCPSLDSAVFQIKRLLDKYKLEKVFLATDAQSSDVDYLKSKLPLVTYKPSEFVLESYGDGGVAIIDQWICAHAKHFIGTSTSTYSFRIQEERDILGFHGDATFNCLCHDDEIDQCEQPSKWRIVY